MRVFLSADAAAISVGADEVGAALLGAARGAGVELELVRTGGRGLHWLEPLVEVDGPQGRVGFGPVAPEDAPGLIASLLSGASHPASLGTMDRLTWLARQERLTFARVGVIPPTEFAAFEAEGGLEGWKRAITLDPEAVIDEVDASGLRGRGGAGFPAGRKWRTVAGQADPVRYVVCNADEGDSGTFADRALIEGDPFTLLEGMRICAHAVGARRGFIYLRSEYPHAARVLAEALPAARAAGLLGDDFDVALRIGAGSYVCGEETALLESLEGKRGQVRAKPPLPAMQGLFGRPTVVHNVLTLAALPWILAHGGAAYAARGVGRSRGTLAMQLGGNVARGGLFEVPLGMSLRELIFDWGGGTASGRPVRAVQVGGPLGAYLPERLLDLPLDYEALAAEGAILGHGGVVVFDDTVDMRAMARFAFAFCARESCGKCTPCRIGSTRGVELLDAAASAANPAPKLALVDDLCELLAETSLCALGGLTPLPVRSAIRHFPEDFHPR